MRNRKALPLLGLVALTMLAGSLGCYETLFRLSPVADAKVDRALCGDWELKSQEGKAVFLYVRNVDDHFYSVCWKGQDEEKPLVFTADSTMVAGVRFVHARALPDDGSLEDSHIIMRVDIEQDHITLRNIDKAFMESRGVTSDDTLRQVVEANLGNNELYDGEVYTGDRMKEH